MSYSPWRFRQRYCTGQTPSVDQKVHHFDFLKVFKISSFFEFLEKSKIYFGLAKNNNWSSSNRVDIYQLINVVFLPKLSPTTIIKRRLVALISGFWVGRISHRFVLKMRISKFYSDFQGKWWHVAFVDSDRAIVQAKLPQWTKRSRTLTFQKFSKFQNFLNF